VDTVLSVNPEIGLRKGLTKGKQIGYQYGDGSFLLFYHLIRENPHDDWMLS
jgi:hypothetical protein